MTRTVSLTRLGIVKAGDGGSAADYSFDADGLSNDPRLAYYLQSLTPAQLQVALDGGDPLPGLADLLHQDITGTGAGSLPCGQPGNPCGAIPGAFAGIPAWAWIAGGIMATALLIGGTRR
jgi:hypothetical protein